MYIYIYIYIYIYVYSYMSLYISFSYLCANLSLPMLPSTLHTSPLPFRLIHHTKQDYMHK